MAVVGLSAANCFRAADAAGVEVNLEGKGRAVCMTEAPTHHVYTLIFLAFFYDLASRKTTAAVAATAAACRSSKLPSPCPARGHRNQIFTDPGCLTHSHVVWLWDSTPA